MMMAHHQPDNNDNDIEPKRDEEDKTSQGEPNNATGGHRTRTVSFTATMMEDGFGPSRLVLTGGHVLNPHMQPMALMTDGVVPASRPEPVERSFRSRLSWNPAGSHPTSSERSFMGLLPRSNVDPNIEVTVEEGDDIADTDLSQTTGQVPPLISTGLDGKSLLYGANGGVLGVLEEGVELVMDDTTTTSQVPRAIVHVMLLVSYSAILQCVADVLIETLMIAGLVPKIELRVSFIFLTFLSALLAMHTLGDIEDNRLDIIVQSMRVGLLVEFGLVCEDIYFVLYESDPYKRSLKFYYRFAFLFLTFINIVLMVKLSRRLRILHLLFPYRSIFGSAGCSGCLSRT